MISTYAMPYPADKKIMARKAEYGRRPQVKTIHGIQNARRIRLLSYNIQAGIRTTSRHHYFTRFWQHALPHNQKKFNLEEIADIISDFDIVGLQELDGGSFRSGFVRHIGYLSNAAGYPFGSEKINRDLAPVARHSIGYLSRIQPDKVQMHNLPGLPGRGAVMLDFSTGTQSLAVVIAHLALSSKARMQQVRYIANQLNPYDHAIVMGDMNCGTESEEMKFLMKNAGLMTPDHAQPTFPSWSPKHHIDHILVSKDISVENVNVLNHPLSDHLPISMEVTLPGNIMAAPCAA